MKIRSPLGEYDYRIRSARFARGRVEIDGNLGVWETTTVIEPSDWAELARRLAPAVVAAVVVLGVAWRLR